MPARLSARITPVSTSTTMSSSPATPMPIITPRRLAGSGFATTRDDAGSCLRPNEYWMRPIAMPTAATPKPQWNPTLLCRNPVTIGPRNAPRLMPR